MKKRYLFNKVAILGTGLIGGSLAVDIKADGLARTITGACRSNVTLNKIKALRIFDEVTRDAAKAVEDADLVILATPVRAIIELAEKVSPYLKRGSIVMDVGSTKQEICRRVSAALPAGVSFVGCHPMAGSEKSGFSNARRGLFKDTMCFVVGKSFASAKANLLWKRLGADVVTLSAGEHDDIVAAISHLPHIAAAALVNSVPKKALKFASGGFKDTTRIASSSAELWNDIFMNNKVFVSKYLDRFISELKAVKDDIKRDGTGLRGRLERASRLRKSVA
ncbi:MAG: hypothetical protein AUJ75_04195 [Candidatus Omnitrophica bacterium CG1_02_49_10]|nr:MAG: hypothetical protein AUJ75_04195 [Candidatus Omnitrophica bacterium CG1_02_49_10]